LHTKAVAKQHRSRILWALGLTILLVLSTQTLSNASGAPQKDGSNDVRVDQRVLNQLEKSGKATFWVFLEEQADLSAAESITGWNERGAFVYERLRATATNSQKDIKQFLTGRGASFQSFWGVNALKVSAGEAVVSDLAQRDDVREILADGTYTIPDPIEGKRQNTIQAVEWNIDRINAPDVWDSFGSRGEGIVVANIDTGVQFDHPAVVNQYRGRSSDGSFDHNYNWFDPSNICGSPSLQPCDNVDHGTHTMGTMVGDDGDPGPNQIGVAPHAKWIAAKGCEFNSCSFEALLASGEWILAPTDLSGANPRPDLRPNIVNNSWGGGPGDPFYQGIVQAWLAAGIFPAFSSGNPGPFCGGAGSPGDYPESYGTGAFDINNNIADFSGRGPSAFGGITKPNIAAPGVDVRSSIPGGGYASFNGTSMAAPHVSGTVALMFSAAPALVGDVAQTRAILDQTAIDTDDQSCGGTPENNNVFGEGRLDAFAAVEQSPRGPSGTLTGTVTDATTGNPIAGATVEVTGAVERTTTTDSAGVYALTLPIGTYNVEARSFGYLTGTATADVLEGQTTVVDFALDPAPSHSVSGTVTDGDGNPLEGATVTILGTPIPPTTTDAAGGYSFASVPEGEYEVRADAGGCFDAVTQTLVVDGDEVLDFALPRRADEFGYTCEQVASDYVEATNVLPLSGDDAVAEVDLPFPFSFYGQTYDSAFVATNGFLNFEAADATFSNSAIPSAGTPNAAIYPFWDDLIVDASSSVRTETLGTSPDQRFVIEWRNVTFFSAPGTKFVDVEVVLHENGRILTQYRSIDDDDEEQGNSATIGIENHDGDVALQYSFGQPSVSDGLAVLYRVPNAAFVTGTVTDANDGLPIAGATVTAVSGADTVETTTNADGVYRLQLHLGTWDLTASANNYESATAQVTLDEEDEVVVQDFVLTTAVADVEPDALEFIVTPGNTKTQTLTLTNSGSAPLNFEVLEAGGGQIATSEVALKEGANKRAQTSQGIYQAGVRPAAVPAAPGDIIRQWTPTGLSLAWGVGYTGSVWLSDVPDADTNHEFTVDGAPTGREWQGSFGGDWPGDMAYVPGLNAMCQVNVGGDNGIYCWDPNTGDIVASITGSFPWTGISQRGLAYRPDDDTFYIGGWNEGIVYHVAGLSHSEPGAVLDSCTPTDPSISGLAWNPAFNILWMATNSPTDTIYQLDPTTCESLGTLAHPQPNFNGAGLEMDEEGNLWMISQFPNVVYLMDSGVPAFTDVPWLSEDPTSGTVPVGGSQEIEVTVDTTGLEPGVYGATIFIRSNAGRTPTLRVPVTLIVPAYRQGVDAGSTSSYVDVNGDSWAADQEYTAGSWGFRFQSRPLSTGSAIGGTDDDALYQTQRMGRRGALEYRFDGLPAGVYQIELKFAELQVNQPNDRLFDVTIESEPKLIAHDIFDEVGRFAADDHTYFMVIEDGVLQIRFAERFPFNKPVINAIRVTHRPDRS
jgi:subtilisin family serine protease